MKVEQKPQDQPFQQAVEVLPNIFIAFDNWSCLDYPTDENPQPSGLWPDRCRKEFMRPIFLSETSEPQKLNKSIFYRLKTEDCV